MTSNHGVGTQAPTCASVEYGTASGLVNTYIKLYQKPTYARTHTQDGQMQGVVIMVIPPPAKARALCTTLRNSGPALDELLELGQVLVGALTCAFQP